MSGIVKSVGKIFKKVGKIVKKIAPYVMIAAAIYFTGGAILAAAPALAGATGAAGAGAAVGGGIGGATAGAGLAAGSGGWLSAIMGSGVGSSALGSLFNSSAFGSVLSGAATALGAKQTLDQRNDFLIDRETRSEERHQIDPGSLFTNLTSSSQGLGINNTAAQISPTTLVQNTPASRPPRPSAIELAQAPAKKPRYQYNPTTGRIDFA